MEKLKDFATLIAELRNGQLVFPTSVNGALQLQLALADPDCHDEVVIARVLAEPVLAARCVALANAATFRPHGTPPLTSARAAVTRLGYRNLYSLATAMVVRQFGSCIRDPQLRAQANQLWKYSAHVAALAYQIAERVTQCDPDTALFAGIVHEAGGFYLLAQADQIAGLLDDPSEWMGAAQEIVAREVMQRLQVPEPVAVAIVSLRGGAVSLPPRGLRDTLLLARHLSPVLSPLPLQADPYLQTSGVLDQYLLDYPTMSVVLEEAAEQARSLSSALLV